MHTSNTVDCYQGNPGRTEDLWRGVTYPTYQKGTRTLHPSLSYFEFAPVNLRKGDEIFNIDKMILKTYKNLDFQVVWSVDYFLKLLKSWNNWDYCVLKSTL